jgi:hypothetical protein
VCIYNTVEKKHCEWWKVDRASKDVIEVESLQSRSLQRDVNVLVYVREVKMDLRLLRDQDLKMILKMIRGQARAYCKIHGKPLILWGTLNWKVYYCNKEDIKYLFGCNGNDCDGHDCDR